MDRNKCYVTTGAIVKPVALLAEGVDRNKPKSNMGSPMILSPSSRRAWIEMDAGNVSKSVYVMVALLAEGVDRNRKKRTS